MVAYIDFFLGGDEKRLDVASTIQKRFPMCIIFGGDGSYMSPYYLHNDTLLTNLLGQYASTAAWNRLVAGLNAQLRTVRRECIRSELRPVVAWLNSHTNAQLGHHGLRVELGWFQATASGYYQLGILVALREAFFNSVCQSDMINTNSPRGSKNKKNMHVSSNSKQLQQGQPSPSHTMSKGLTGGVNGGIINEVTLKSLDYRRDYLFPLSLLLKNTRPVGFQETLQLLICIMLLGDFTVTVLTLVQFYWMSLGAFLAVLLILPLSMLSPFAAGLNALFSRGPKRSSLARVYALWNATSIVNIMVAFICGIIYCGLPLAEFGKALDTSKLREDNEWWLLLIILLLIKPLNACLVNWHIANLEIQDLSLFSPDPEKFWTM